MPENLNVIGARLMCIIYTYIHIYAYTLYIQTHTHTPHSHSYTSHSRRVKRNKKKKKALSRVCSMRVHTCLVNRWRRGGSGGDGGNSGRVRYGRCQRVGGYGVVIVYSSYISTFKKYMYLKLHTSAQGEEKTSNCI